MTPDPWRSSTSLGVTTLMPKVFPQDFRDDAVAIALKRESSSRRSPKTSVVSALRVAAGHDCRAQRLPQAPGDLR